MNCINRWLWWALFTKSYRFESSDCLLIGWSVGAVAPPTRPWRVSLCRASCTSGSTWSSATSSGGPRPSAASTSSTSCPTRAPSPWTTWTLRAMPTTAWPSSSRSGVRVSVSLSHIMHTQPSTNTTQQDRLVVLLLLQVTVFLRDHSRLHEGWLRSTV